MEHETRKEALPSVIEVFQFSSSHKQPCLADFNDLWAQHLVATQMCDKIMRHGECCAFVIGIDVEPLEYMAECRKQIYQAIYRILIAGATLSGLYNAPSYTSDPIDPSDDELSDEQQEALLSLPAFCMRSDPEEDDAMFGAFTRWLRDDILADTEAREALAQRHKSKTGRGLCCWYNNPTKNDFYCARFGYERTEPQRCALVDVDGLSHSDIHLIGWRVMQMLHVHDLVLTIVKRFRSPSPPPGAPIAYRTIPIVFLGEFRAYEVHLTRVESEPLHMVLRPPAHRGDPKYDSEIHRGNWHWVLTWVINDSGQPNAYTETEALVTPLMFKVLDHVLRRLAGVRLPLDFFGFEHDDHRGDYTASVYTFFLFASDTVEGREPIVWDYMDGDYMDGSEMLMRVGVQEPATYYQPEF